MDVVIEYKEKGNAAFSSGDMGEAVRWYGAAIEQTIATLQGKRDLTLSPDLFSGAALVEGKKEATEILPTLFSNRSAALLKLGKYKEALADADNAIAMKPMWAKAFHRKAQALAAMGFLDQARDTYSMALDGDPTNKFLKKQVEELDAKTGRQSAYAKIETYLEQHGTIKGCPTKLSLSMFELLGVLGEGNYSTVTKAMFKKTGEVFAIKSVDKSKVDRMSKRHPNIHNELRMEKKLLLRMNHPNIIKLHHTMQDVSCLYFVQEFAPGGELWAKLRFGNESLKSLRPSLARFYMAQVVNALDYMRLNGVVHRDIKPENMMLFPDPSTNGRIEFLKIIDFGTAYDTVETDLNGPKFVGTPEYMSPEAIAAKSDPTFALDVWALGCCLFQLHSGKLPFKGSSPYLTFLKTQALNYEMPNYFSPELQDLLQRMFKEDPAERIGACDEYRSLKSHPYFKGIDFLQLQSSPVVPVPTLLELSLEAAMDTLFVQKGESFKVHPALDGKRSTADSSLPKWATKLGVFSSSNTRKEVRDLMMGYLAQRLALGRPGVFRMFFDSEYEARFKRTASKTYIGLSEQEQGKFKDPYLVAHIGSLEGCSVNQIEETVRRINKLEPTPKLVLLGGPVADFETNRAALSYLDSKIPIAACYSGDTRHADIFGETYYSMYVGGVLYIVINSFLLRELAEEDESKISEEARKHEEWFEREILQGKLCARHVVVVSYHAWFLPPEEGHFVHTHDDDSMIPPKVIHKFLEKLQEATTQLVLSTAAKSNYSQFHKPKSDLHSKICFTNTTDLAGGTTPFLRIVRVQDVAIVSDKYTLEELPPWFSLEKVALQEEEVEEDKGFSDISSSSDEDE